MHVYLKIKIKSLAAEATMIRQEERKQNPGHRARVRARRIISGQYRPREGESIANDDDARRSRAARILKIKPNMEAFYGLKDHRTNDVRSEARSSFLAYGFLRGRSYSQIEQTHHTAPDWKRVEQLVRKYGTDDIRDRMQRFEEWKQQAEE